jgi:glycosyltransferase involved in cell wall biosynthesis
MESEVVPTGVDTSFFTPDVSRRANERLRVLFVGALRPFKRPDMVAEAAARFPGMDFAIVGHGPMRAELEKRAIALPNMRLVGNLSRTDLREQYRRSDIFLFPSRWEGSPKVIMEAAACGLPVIACKDYEPETVIDGETGFLIGTEQEAHARLTELAASSDLRCRMGKAGRTHIAKFDWDKIARRWEEIFSESAAAGQRISN